MTDHTIDILVSADGGQTRETRPRVPTWAQAGLAVTRAAAGKSWTITHSPSGYAVWYALRSEAQACALAEQLVALGDWTREQSELSADADLIERFRAFRQTQPDDVQAADRYGWARLAAVDEQAIAPTPSSSSSSPIGVLGLDSRLVSILGRSQIITVGQPADLSPREVASLRNVGPRYRSDIEAALAKHDLALHPERPGPTAPQLDSPITLRLTRVQARELLHVLEFLDNALMLALEAS